MIVFMHIPKTAGTSVRSAFESRLSKDAIVFEYGQERPITSAVAKSYLTGELDAEGFRRRLTADRTKLLVGHFPASRYFALFPDAAWVTYIRHPVDRLFSAYRHHLRTGQFSGDFESFIEQPRLQNQQTKMLGAHLDAFAFIGVTEHYAADLASLSVVCGLVPPLSVGRANVAADALMLSAADRAAAAELNAEDMRLYDELARRRRSGPSAGSRWRALVSRVRHAFARG